MKKTFMALSSVLLAGSLLTGCGTADDNDMGVNNDNMENVGFYNNGDNDNRLGRDGLNNRDNLNQIGTNRDMTNNGNGGNGDTNENENFGYDSELSRRIASQVSRLSGVDDANVLINGNTVIVAVDAEGTGTNDQGLEEKVRTTAKGLARDKGVRVVMDEGIFNRIGNVTDRMDNNQMGNEVRSDIQGILNDIGDAARRPFENNQ